MTKQICVAVLSMVSFMSFSVFAGEDESSSYVEEVIDLQTVEQLPALEEDGLVEEDPVMLIFGNEASEPVNEVAEPKPVAMKSTSSKQRLPYSLKVSLEYMDFSHTDNYSVNYPVDGLTFVSNDYSAELINLVIAGDYVYNQKHYFNVLLKTAVSASLDLNASNSSNSGDPSFTKVGFGYAYGYLPNWRAGGQLEFISFDTKYTYHDLNKDYSDEITTSTVKAFIGYEDQKDLMSWGVDFGLSLTDYSYDSKVTTGVTPGYNASLSSMNLGFFAEANVGYELSKNFILEGHVGFLASNASSVEGSVSGFTSSIDDMENSEFNIGAGVVYTF